MFITGSLAEGGAEWVMAILASTCAELRGRTYLWLFFVSGNRFIPFLSVITLYTLLANIVVGKKIIMFERADPISA